MAAPGTRRSRGPGRRTLLVRRLLIVAVAMGAAALAGPAPVAQAHAFLESSNPADGQVLATAPAQLRLDFSESVVLSATRIDIVDATGRHITPTGLTVATSGGSGGTEQPVQVVGDLPPLGRSSYRVSWETLSSDDLHRTSGVLVFGVGQTVTAGGLAEPSPPPAEAALRWLILLGLSGSLGGALAGRLLRGVDVIRGGAVAGTVSAWGGALGAASAVALLADQVVAGGAGATQLLWSSYGARWGLREIGLLLLVGAALARLHHLRVVTSRLLLLTGATLACAGTALLGHSGAGVATNVTRVVASAAHLGAATTWSGCLVVLGVVVLPRLRKAGPGGDRARIVLRRFGPPAAVCVGVMIVTGVYLSSEVVGSVDAALFTIYGRALLLKVALAGVAGALALVNTLRLHRRHQRPTPRRTVVAEAVAALGVLILAAVLTSGQPAMEPQLVHTATAATGSLLDRSVADLQETVSIRPNRPGPNVVVVGVLNTRRPAPAPVRTVQVSLASADGAIGAPLTAEPLSNGQWSVNTTLDTPGALTVQVAVQRPGLPDATASYRWTVGGLPDQARPAVVSTDPIGPGLRVAAAALLAALVASWLALVLVPRIRRLEPSIPSRSARGSAGS